MDGIIEFLNENYIYVAGIGLIIILILIGFLTSRKGKKINNDAKEEPMENINEINTGEINQVANNLNQETENVNDITPSSDTLMVDEGTMEPVVGEPVQEEPQNEVTNDLMQEEDDQLKIEPVDIASMPQEEPSIGENEPVIPVIDNISTEPIKEPVQEEEKFEKTEVIDLSELNTENEEKKEPVVDYVSYVPDNSAENNEQPVLNGEETILSDTEENNL